MTSVFNRTARITLMVGVLLIFPRQTRVADAQERGKTGGENQRGIAEVTTRFSDTMSPARTKGAATPLHVELKEWHLAGQGVPIEIGNQGFYVAHLVWGNISTQINGASTVRKPGDFWTVEKGTGLVITIKKPGEEALIQTFSVNPGR